MIGFVYVLGNEYMPNVVKIGCTERAPHERAKELGKATGVPGEFRVIFYVELENFQSFERRVHEELELWRVDGKEFFESDSSGEFNNVWRAFVDYASQFLTWATCDYDWVDRARAAHLSDLAARELARIAALDFVGPPEQEF